MVDEELQNDEITLDDFNFDDLPDMADTEENSDVQTPETSADFDFGDFSFDDLNVGDTEPDSADDGLRKEPFFETSPEETAEDEISFDESAADVDVTDAVPAADIPQAEEDDELSLPEEEIVGEEMPVVEDEVSETDFAEGENQSDGSDATDDFSVDDYLAVAAESENTAQVNEADGENAATDEVAETEIDELSESGFVDEIPEETPLNDEVSFSTEEAEEAHEEFFSGTEPVVEDTDIFAGIDQPEYAQSSGGYSAVSAIEESSSAGYAKWYSGQSDLKMFEIAKGFESGSVNADEECKTLHVNAGYDTYGWEVQFSDGVVMNLRDVREYQIRNGRLPNPDGRIIYGHSSLLFSGLERIVIYESVKYFSYGI